MKRRASGFRAGKDRKLSLNSVIDLAATPFFLRDFGYAEGTLSPWALDPLKGPTRLQTALQALYGHYETTFKLWQDKGIKLPPCFIIVCQNTATGRGLDGRVGSNRPSRPARLPPCR